MADHNTEVFFRTSMSGYRKQDVIDYIEKLGQQRRAETEKLVKENEQSRRQIALLQSELTSLHTTLDDTAASLKNADESRETAEEALRVSRSESEQLSARVRELHEESETLRNESSSLQAQLEEKVSALVHAETALKDAENARDTAEESLRVSRLDNEELTARSSALQAELESLRNEQSEILAQLRMEADALHSDNSMMEHEKENRSGTEWELNSRVGEIICSAKDTADGILEKAEQDAAEIRRKAEQDAEQIRAKAARDAAVIQIQGKTQREDVSNLIDKKLQSVFSADMDLYENQISEMLVGLSTTYKTLSSGNNDLCESLLRNRPEQIAEIRESILRSLELQTSTDIDDTPDDPAES